LANPASRKSTSRRATSNSELRTLSKASPSVAAARVTSSLATSSAERSRNALPPQIYATPSNLIGRWCNLAIRCCDAKRSGGYTGECHELPKFDLCGCSGNCAACHAIGCSGGRFWQVPQLQGAMGSHRQPEQLDCACGTASAHPRISEDMGRHSGRPEGRRARQLAIDVLH